MSEIDNTIYQSQVIDLNKKNNIPKKNVSWGENEIKLDIIEDTSNDIAEDDIFKLFKKVPIKTTEDHILLLQQDIKNMNAKLDLILEVLTSITPTVHPG